MQEKSVLFFDLFFTLVVPVYEKYEKKNEYHELGINQKKWEQIAEDEELYRQRATGKVSSPVEIISKILDKYCFDYNYSDLEKIAYKRMKRFQRCLSEIDEKIIKTLEYLSNNNKKLCIISNADLIDKIGWVKSPLKKYFRDTIFSCDVGVLKPERKIYEIALKQMKAKPEECVFIGDGGSNELYGAKRVGLNTILTTHYIDEKRRDTQYADFVVNKFEKIIDLF